MVSPEKELVRLLLENIHSKNAFSSASSAFREHVVFISECQGSNYITPRHTSFSRAAVERVASFDGKCSQRQLREANSDFNFNIPIWYLSTHVLEQSEYGNKNRQQMRKTNVSITMILAVSEN